MNLLRPVRREEDSNDNLALFYIPEEGFTCGEQQAMSAQRARRRKIWSNIAVVGAAVFFTAYLYCIQLTVKDSANAIPSPVKFSQLHVVEQRVYHPGDTIRFDFLKEISQDNIAILTLDTWQNLSTGESYPGPILGRVAKKGVEQTVLYRRLPENLSTGEYILEGWASAQLEKRALPARYFSETFQVIDPDPLKIHPAKGE
jgi:hypothetical protein